MDIPTRVFLWILLLIFTYFTSTFAVCPNQCMRNVDCDAEPDEGCPSCEREYYGRQCQYRTECRYTNLGKEYRGLKNTTDNGIVCQKWSSQSPNTHPYTSQEGNYCRNPDNSGAPWCYTTNPSVRWRYCGVPLCNTVCPAPPLPPGSDILNPATPGIGFNYTYVADIECPDKTVVQSTCHAGTWSNMSCPEIFCALDCGRNITYANISYGESFTLLPKEGFLIKPENSLLKCLANASFDKVAMCNAITCQLLNISNTVIHQLQDIYYYGETITLECALGYKSDRNLSYTLRTCVSENNWNGTAIFCERVQCPDFPLPGNSHYIVNNETAYYYEDSIEVRCTSGYHSSVTYSVHTCVESATWSGKLLDCLHQGSQLYTQKIVAITVPSVLVPLVAICIIVLAVVCQRRRQLPNQSNCRNSRKGDELIAHTLMRANSKKNEEQPAEVALYSEIYKYCDNEVKTDDEHNENKTKDVEDGLEDKDEEEDKEYAEVGGDYLNDTVTEIPKSELRNYIKNKAKIFSEFQELEPGPPFSRLEAISAKNIHKNKYKDKYPYDKNRVVLSTDDGGGDYINASWITNGNGDKQFIAAQGPIAPTIVDFWRMIWQYDVMKIVMLTNPTENGKLKCTQYWPESGSIKYGDFTVETVALEVFRDYSIRRLSVRKEDGTLRLSLFKYDAWIDMGVPNDTVSLAVFHRVVMEHRYDNGKPTVVHCSAGIGRTGTFLALHFVLEKSKDMLFVNVFESVQYLREQRFMMVQTKEQYLFLHAVLYEAMKIQKTAIKTAEFAQKYAVLKNDGLQRHYEALETYVVPNSRCSVAIENVNKGKNRFDEILPVDEYRCILSGGSLPSENYINAVFLPGVHLKHEFIITQTPLHFTIIDFWKLIYQEDIYIIVTLNNNPDESCGKYSPDSLILQSNGPYAVKLLEIVNLPNGIRQKKLELAYDKKKRIIFELIADFWKKDEQIPSSPDGIIDLIEKVELIRDQSNDVPVLVHCQNGCTNSGLYCVVASIIARVKSDKLVLIPTVVEQLRKRRPQIIQNIEQYQFCYSSVEFYLNSLEVYGNI